jgi:hypothetical protein
VRTPSLKWPLSASSHEILCASRGTTASTSNDPLHFVLHPDPASSRFIRTSIVTCCVVSHLCSWSEFCDCNAFKVPNQKDYVDRFQVNLTYYQGRRVRTIARRDRRGARRFGRFADNLLVSCCPPLSLAANYLGVVLASLVLVCFWRPVFLIGLAAIVGSAIYLFSVRTAPIVVAEKVLTKKEVLLGQWREAGMSREDDC